LVTLYQKSSFRVPVDAENVTPDAFAGKSVNEIKSLHLWEGNHRRALSDLFKVDCEEGVCGEDVNIQIVGDLTKVKRLGARMSRGRIVVEGSVGMRLGEEMSGGDITVTGNAGSWAGMMMKGGKIEVAGNVGDYIGASYRGSTVGMKSGAIIVRGDAGNEVGCFMNGGFIRIGGNVEQFMGMHMRNGGILVEGDAGDRVGAEMMGGRIVVLGKVSTILPSFIVDEIRPNVRVGDERVSGPFYVFKGDVTESWNGSLYVAIGKNLHLKVYESKIA